MKQVAKTGRVLDLLRQAAGADVNLDNLSVFESIALNTLPLRKNHPLFRGAIADVSLLREMSLALAAESRPVQIMHDDMPLPIGRVFHGEVVANGNQTELRTLFWVDNKANGAEVEKIDNGTVDQVSVSIVPKHIFNSVSGFDYLGAEATGENVWTGTDNDGNTLGENGAYGKLVGLDQFFELSLVGMGGAQNARIVPREQSHFGSSLQKLAASGLDPNIFVLSATTRTENMDLTALVTQLSDVKAKLSIAETNKTADDATITALKAKITELEGKLAAAGEGDTAITTAKIAAGAIDATKITGLEEQLAAAMTAIKGVAQKVLTAAGKLTVTVPEDLAAIEAIINETSTGMAAALALSGKSKDTVADVNASSPVSLGSYRSPR